MYVTLRDRLLPQIVIALEHYTAYLNATKRNGKPFQDIGQEPMQCSHLRPIAGAAP